VDPRIQRARQERQLVVWELTPRKLLGFVVKNDEAQKDGNRG
jgi:hypothetical protein